MPQLSQYDSVDSLSSSAKEIFMANASVPAFGPTEQGGSNGNYNIPVSEIGSSLPAISAGDGGKVLTVNSNEDGATWEDVPGELPAIGASDAGKVLTVNSNSDDVVWATPGGGSSLPSYGAGDANKVLTVNAQGTGVEWTTAGGGGGSSEVEVIDFKCYYDDVEDVRRLISVSKTVNEALTSLNSGKQLCARLCMVDENDPTNIWEITTYPFSYLYYSEGGTPMLYFNWGVGSGGGGGNTNGIIYNGIFERWEGPWYGDWN